MNEAADPVRRLEARVYGRVHGVGFREFVRAQAEQLRLVGWVRNAPDGTVELVAEGDPAALEALLAALRKGPPAARVACLTSHLAPAAGAFRGFHIRP